MTPPKTDPASPTTRTGDGLQRIDVKIPIDLAEGVWQDPICDRLLAVFGRWRTEEGEDIVDLQDYSHVTFGPGVILVSKRWVLSVDFGHPGPGILLSVRRGLSGSLADRLEAAVRAAQEKAARLLGEAELKGLMELRTDTLMVTVNDRLRYPNADDAADEIASALTEALRRIGSDEPFLIRDETPKERLSYQVSLGLDEDELAGLPGGSA